MLKVFAQEIFDEGLKLSNGCDGVSCHRGDSDDGGDDDVMISRFGRRHGDGDDYDISYMLRY